MTAVDIVYPNSQAMQLLQSQGRERPVESSRYLCKICSKGFVSGRALGGHMRAHLPACMPADKFIETEFRKSKKPRVSDDQSMEEKDDEEGFDGNGANLVFALRRNPKRTWKSAYWDDSFLLEQGLDSDSIDSCLDCDLCGKEFSSWKGLFGHMNCCCETHQDGDDASLEESHKHETQDEEDKIGDSNSEIEMEIDQPSGNLRRFDKWVKEKRFKRPRYVLQRNPDEQFASVINNEEEDMALCLVMLANGVNTPQNPQFQFGVADPESGHLKPPNNGSQLPKSISKKVKYKKINGDASLYDDDEDKKGKYKCTTCNKIFHSYQALGGHRARHGKVKRCFAQIEDEQESLEEEITDDELNIGSSSQLPGNFHNPHSKESTKVSGGKARDGTRTIEFAAISGKKIPGIHECSICKRGFASGQALGGHKRCHWGSEASDTIITSCGNKETPMLQQLPARVELLDLNMPAPFDDDGDAGDLNTLDGNAVDSHGTSHAQTHNPPSLLSSLMSNHPRQGLFLYNSDADLSKDDEADGKVGKDIRFGRWSDSEFPVRAQTWLQL